MKQPPESRSTSRFATAAALLTLSALCFAPIFSHGIPTPLDELFSHSIDVQVVNVDVVVTDREGNLVTDLTPEDFELYRDGERIEIDYFSSPAEMSSEVAANETPANETPANEQLAAIHSSAQPQAQPPAAAIETPAEPREPLYVVLYLDQNHLRPMNRARIVSAARDFLNHQLGPDDPAMLVVFNRNLRIAQPFTLDRQLLLDALDEASREVTVEMLMNSESSMLESQAAYSGRAGGQSAPNFGSSGVEEGEHHTYTSLASLQSFVTQLAGLPHRKAIVHISNGFRGVRQLRNHLEATTRMANASRITFYPIDARGSNRTGVSASRLGRGGPIGDGGFDQPLNFLAEQTGGFALLRSQRFGEAFGRIATDMRAPYSLGFTLQDTDEEYHSLRVEVRRRDLQVRHREGFIARSQRSRLIQSTLASLHFAPPSNSMGLELMQTPETASNEILVRVPLDRLSLLNQDAMLSGQVQLVIALHVDGDLAPLRQVRLPLRIPEDRRDSLPPYIAYKLDLPDFDQRLTVAVGARDQYASGASFAALHLDADERP